MSEPILPVTERTRVRRVHDRGHFDRETINQILDICPHCHVGYQLDGKPIVTPTLQWREGNKVYWHGSSASRAIRKSGETDVCLTVSTMDGLVLARSAFHHSANYRAVMIFGKAEIVSDPDEKTERLRAFVDGLFPGRWDMLRPMTAKEVKATTLLSLPIEEASAKIRTGGPVDDEEDYKLPIWAGIIPIQQKILAPINDPRNLTEVTVPDHVSGFKF